MATDEGRLKLWEATVRERPWIAKLSGPPSWLVLQEWKGDKAETFHTANLRVRERYGLEGEVSTPNVHGEEPMSSAPSDMSTVNVHSQGEMSTVDTHGEDPLSTVVVPPGGLSTVDKWCACGQRAAPLRTRCWACIKRGQRAGS